MLHRLIVFTEVGALAGASAMTIALRCPRPFGLLDLAIYQSIDVCHSIFEQFQLLDLVRKDLATNSWVQLA